VLYLLTIIFISDKLNTIFKDKFQYYIWEFIQVTGNFNRNFLKNRLFIPSLCKRSF